MRFVAKRPSGPRANRAKTETIFRAPLFWNNAYFWPASPSTPFSSQSRFLAKIGVFLNLQNEDMWTDTKAEAKETAARNKKKRWLNRATMQWSKTRNKTGHKPREKESKTSKEKQKLKTEQVPHNNHTIRTRQDHPTTTTKSSQAQIRQKKEQTGAQKNWIPPNARSIVLHSTQFTQQSQEWNKHMKTTNGDHLKPTKESVKWDGPRLPVLQVRGTVRLLEELLRKERRTAWGSEGLLEGAKD